MINKNNKDIISFSYTRLGWTHYICDSDYLGYDYDFWETYDNNKNIIGYYDNENYWYTEKYDANNNIIYHNDSNGCKYWNRYDERGNFISNRTGFSYKLILLKDYLLELKYEFTRRFRKIS